MSALHRIIEEIYERSKRGEWPGVMSDWRSIPVLIRRCSRYQRPSSGWTFLHQAAYFGNELACRELIRAGAAIARQSNKGQTAADVSDERGHRHIAALLRQADTGEDSLWAPSEDPDLLPSSNLWRQAIERRATESLLAAYGGGVITIRSGSRYFVDAFDRILVGWHGTYDPPSGMDGESMVSLPRNKADT